MKKMPKPGPWTLAAAALLAAVAAVASSSKLVVNVEEAKIRKDRQFYAPVVAAVKYGDKVEAGAHEDGWYAVTFKGQRGYLHESALGAKASKAMSSQWSGGDEAGNDEVTLAGKGFNDDVEKAYRKQHGDIDYAPVDAMGKRIVNEATLLKFMRAGGTMPAEASK